jgi:glycerol uptake facilitator-like aquaporin
MRTLSAAAIFGAVTTFLSALALRAPDATVAVAATAATVAFVTWLAALHSTDQTSGLALSSPAAALTLAAVRRTPGSSLLPLIAAQVVGAVAGGFGALGLESQLAGTLTWAEPSPIAVGVATGVIGLVLAWVILAVDGGESTFWTGAGPLLSAAALGTGLAAAVNPAVVLGLATAGVLTWTTAAIAAVVGLVAAYVGAYAISVVTPTDEPSVS